MAYARYDRNSDWYIFWHSSSEDLEARSNAPRAKEEETLAVWHCDHRSEGPLFTYAEVRRMVESSDFSRIPGYTEAHRELISGCLSEFLQDVDANFGAA